jgi:DNA-binding MarR family transcriptional regulator
VVTKSERVALRAEMATSIYGLGATVVRRIPRELSLTAVSTLATLQRTGPRRVTDLALVQGVSQPSMTSLIGSLESAGHVERHSDPGDRRVTLVALTDEGAAVLQQRRRVATDSLLTLIDQLTDEEIAALAAALPALDRLHQLDEQERGRPR